MQGPSSHLFHEFAGDFGQEVADGSDDEYQQPADNSLGGLNAPLLKSKKPKPATAAAQPDDSSWLVMMSQRVLWRGRDAAQAQSKQVRSAIVSVQPKTMFSIERTFLEWV